MGNNRIQLDTMTHKELDRITHHELLTKEEEQKLCARIADGDEEAVKSLVEKNLRLVVHIGKNYTTSRMTLGDVISLGVIGLYNAAKKFKLSEGVRFSTYASIWIKNELRKAYYDQKSSIISIPKWLSSVEKKKRIGLELTPGEKDCLEKAETARRIIGNLHPTESSSMLYANFSKGGLDDEAFSFVQRQNRFSSTPLNLPEEEEEFDFAPEDFINLRTALSRLIPADREVIVARFGLSPYERAFTLKEIGDSRGLSKERIRQIQKRAMERLKAIFTELRGEVCTNGSN